MEKLYFNGTILTMAATGSVEAVLTDGGIIKAAGSRSELEAAAADAEKIDLRGHAMLPAFIDAHSHFSSYAMSFLQAPLDECCDFAEIAGRIKRFIQANNVKPGDWVIAKGYDHNALAENIHPTLALADAAAPENPLIMQHASGHSGVFNSLALRAFGITADTPSPEGGRIGCENGALTGYMEENAYFTYMKKAPMPGMSDMLSAYKKAQDSYAAHGITTIQEGMTVSQMIPFYQLILKQDMLKLDLVAYAAMPDAEAICAAFPEAVRRYDGHLKIGGCKIFLDGSPQGRTAWMRTPYLDETPPYFGYGTMKDEEVASAVRTASRRHLQILAHCNGDAAAQQYLDAIAKVSTDYDVSSLRPVMIHAQLLGRDQLGEVKRLGVMPSFFAAHVWHWGDVHIRNFGLERASQISPAHSALERGIRFSFHQDTPVIEPDMLETVWCAVNRITKAGVSLGADERIAVTDALKAVTINAAYQYFEEDSKGSIEAGKNADFVILDRDPLAVGPMEIRNIKVLQTVKDGRVIFDSPE